MTAWAALALLAAVVLARAGSSRSRRDPKSALLRHAPLAAASLLLVYAAALAAGAATGASDPLRPLQGLTNSPRPALVLPPVGTATGPAADIAGSYHGTRAVMLDFQAGWCVPHRRFDCETFSDAGVGAAPLSTDVTVSGTVASGPLVTRLQAS